MYHTLKQMCFYWARHCQLKLLARKLSHPFLTKARNNRVKQHFAPYSIRLQRSSIKICRYVIFILGAHCLLLGVTQAQAKLYNIELIVFEHAGEQQHPIFPLPVKPDFSNAASMDTLINSGAYYRPLLVQKFRLTKQALQIKADSNYRLLLHTAWQQPVHTRANKPLRLASLPAHQQNQSHWQLDGAIALSRQKFIEFNGQFLFADARQREIIVNAKRRMRSNELNYFDHPRFGILVKVSPIA